MAEAMNGIEWGPILRLAVPALIAIALLSGAMWMFERRSAARPEADGPARIPADATGALEKDDLGPLVRLPLGASELRLRWCPPGRFLMGSPSDEPEREACEDLHGVQLTRGFWMLEGELSNGQVAAVAADLPQARLDPQLPASEMSLSDCQEWLDLLNRRLPGLGARLPSEAEWEYACRAGSGAPFAKVDSPPRVCTHPGVLAAWREGQFAAESAWLIDRDHPALRPHAAGAGGANAWGLRDLHGNLAEWCADRWDGATPYGEQPRTDPLNQFGGLNCVRGGSWLHPPALCRAAARAASPPGEAKPWLGFRLVVSGGASPSWPPR
jgi:formylglycine-generating enzyme required for sulfatase activity